MVYDYRCKDCGNIQEEKHGMTETPTIECSSCGSHNTHKYLGNTNFRVLFKGGGWAGKESALDKIGAPNAVRNNAYKMGAMD